MMKLCPCEVIEACVIDKFSYQGFGLYFISISFITQNMLLGLVFHV